MHRLDHIKAMRSLDFVGALKIILRQYYCPSFWEKILLEINSLTELMMHATEREIARF
jgi:hypothetical protein